MSLIPSESYSFPDHFTNTVVPSRKPKQEKPPEDKPKIVALPDPEPEPVIAAESPEPGILSEIWEPEAAQIKPIPRSVAPVESEIWEPEIPQIKPPPPAPRPVPNPALRRAQAPPARIPDPAVRKIAVPPNLKPKVRWNNRAPVTDATPARNNMNGNGTGNGSVEVPHTPLPAQNVIPMKAPRPAPPRPPQNVPPPPRMVKAPIQPTPPPRKPQPIAPVPRPVQVKVAPRSVQAKPTPQKPPAPAPVIVNPQADFFEMFSEDGYGAATRRRREMKFRRFLACEAAALLVLLPLVILGLTLDISVPAIRWIMNIFTIAAAVSAALIPIIFYAVTPTLPEIER